MIQTLKIYSEFPFSHYKFDIITDNPHVFCDIAAILKQMNLQVNAGREFWGYNPMYIDPAV